MRLNENAKMKQIYLLFFLLCSMFFWGCDAGSQQQESLPYLGNRHTEEMAVWDPASSDSIYETDTVYHRIAPFSFLNQEGKAISNKEVEGKVYVADFFFTTCPTICPVMKKQMLRVYDKFKQDPDFKILSHTIDPKHDTVALLKDYALRLGVEDASTWNFLTGDQERIFEIGQTSYLSTAMEDNTEPGGLLHSGAFILIDKEGHIRGVYDGTKEDQVNKLMSDIPKILGKNEEN